MLCRADQFVCGRLKLHQFDHQNDVGADGRASCEPSTGCSRAS
jgi:hypothetical protein